MGKHPKASHFNSHSPDNHKIYINWLFQLSVLLVTKSSSAKDGKRFVYCVCCSSLFILLVFVVTYRTRTLLASSPQGRPKSFAVSAATLKV